MRMHIQMRNKRIIIYKYVYDACWFYIMGKHGLVLVDYDKNMKDFVYDFDLNQIKGNFELLFF